MLIMKLSEQSKELPRWSARASGVYVITCIANGKKYIGSSCNVARRYKEHTIQLSSGIHSPISLQRDFQKYGLEAFEFDLIRIFKDKKNAWLLEQSLIKEFVDTDAIYNRRHYTKYTDPALKMSKAGRRRKRRAENQEEQSSNTIMNKT